MSRFFSSKYQNLKAYTPGEQPRGMRYIKLNTNESPYPPSESVRAAVAEESGRLALYSDPECTDLIATAAARFGVEPDEILMSNGSDEILNFAFMAFSDAAHPVVFPDITYGFYPVFAQLSGIPYETIPLMPDFSIRISDYMGIGKNIVIANPNAPTGLALPVSDIEKIVSSNPGNVVVIDEAYVDFGAESTVPLIRKYPNLLVTGTFSKSRSMAGARLGFGIGDRALIRDLKTIQYSTNPYNVNRMTAAAGKAALLDDGYYMENCRKIATCETSLSKYEHVRVRGVMGMATNVDDEEEIRKEFKQIRETFALLKSGVMADAPYFNVVSMGMSHDYPIAVEEGSTMVRVGSRIFGERQY